ncbi:MAG TPA: hypothetical protein VKY59_08725 [Spirillospora sp.]|nr:hypothetical protein [Spirillospora sp.]
MSELVNTLEGIGQRLEVYTDRVLVKRTDFLATLLPVGFSGLQAATYSEIERVDLYEPEHLRLKNCESGCLQLIITRRDHTTFSLMLKPEQRQAAQAIREHIQAQLSQTEEDVAAAT